MSDSQKDIRVPLLQDASTSAPGIVAKELAEELESGSNSYGAIPETQQDEEDDMEGYALPKSKLYIVAFSIFTGSYLAALDTTIVTTLLTQIASDLNAISKISWIATAYLLSCSAFQPLFGKLSDIFGRKALLLLCSFFFAVGCLISVTDSLTMLVLGRFITGIGGGGLTSLGTIAMSDLVPLRDRGLYQGIGNVFFGLGSASGGIVGGFIADRYGWKNVFLLQVPLAITVGVLIYIYLELPAGSPGLGAVGTDVWVKLKRVDVLGSSLLVLALSFIMSAAAFGGREIAYYSVSFFVLVICSFLLLAAFIYVELYVSPEPTIPIRLLADRTVLSSSLTNWFFTMGVFTYLFYVPIYYTSVLQLNSTENGLRLIPNFFGVSIGSVGSGYYMKKTGKYYKFTVLIGLLTIFGVLKIYYINPEVTVIEQYLLLVLPGIGYAAILTITLLALIAAVPVNHQAATTSIQYAFRATGSTLGVSIASSFFQRILLVRLTNGVNGLVDDPEEAASIISKALENVNYITEAPEIVKHVIKNSYDAGCHGAFLFSFLTVITGYITSLFMKEHTLHSNIKRT